MGSKENPVQATNDAAVTQGKAKVAKVFSGPLFARDCKSNLPITVVLLAIMMLMCAVLTVAANVTATEKTSRQVEDVLEEFFTYLGGMAAYNQSMGKMKGVELSCVDYLEGGHENNYEDAFEFINENFDLDEELSVERFDEVLAIMQTSEVPLDTYISEFEYAFQLAQGEGVFTGDELDMEGMLKTTLTVAGVSTDLVEHMSEMDTSSLLNTMYFKVIGLLPIFLLIVLLGNSLLASLVDKGSMGYVLSTPTKRSAVAITQAVFMVVVPAILVAIVCAEKIALTTRLTDTANPEMLVTMYIGWYLLVEATAALCYFGGCLFNTSGKALAFGGGLTVWFFIASFLGVFGGTDLVNMGMGVEQLSVFNNLTLTGLFDINAIGTIGSDAVDTSYLLGLGVLGIIAVVFYIAGAVVFCKKDLPL